MRPNLSIKSDHEGHLLHNIFSGFMIFGFIVAAFATSIMALNPIKLSIDARHWQPVSAIITDHYFDARENQYAVQANYEYRWNDEPYKASRVFFDETVGLRRSYYVNINRQFSRHMSPSNPITVWVNPEKPTQSVIFKHIRWDKFAFASFFCACFAAFGFGPLWVWYSDSQKEKT